MPHLSLAMISWHQWPVGGALAAAVFIFSPAVTLSAAEPLAIVADPGRFGTVERAAAAEREVDWWDDDLADDAACTESFAALELRRLLARCLARPESDIALVRPDQIPATGRVFLIASGAAAWLARVAPAAADDAFAPRPLESFRLGDFADAQRVVTVIKGRDRVGALYGVYAYAEKLGVRFYGLGEPGTVWPKAPVELPAGLDRAESPGYVTRGFWAFENRGEPDFFAWMARNRLNFWTVASGQDNHVLKKLGLQLTGGHHNVQFYCLGPGLEYPYRHAKFGGDPARPADPYPVSAEYAGDANGDGRLSYFEAHPEWYCLQDGKRSANITAEFGDNYCTSNPQATRELTRRLLDQCLDGQWREADVINFWMLDGGNWCSCEPCREQGTFTDRLMVVMDAVLKAFQAARSEGRLQRRLRLVSLAYHETLPAPAKPLPADFDYANFAMTFFPIERCYAHPFADPTCTEANTQLVADYAGWTKGKERHYTGTIFVGEYYNLSAFKSLPLVFPKVMAADIPWYHANGARHFHYMHTLTRRWGTWTLNQFLMARLLWNPGASADRLLEEYLRDYYPTTGATMQRFYADLELASANGKALLHYLGPDGPAAKLRARLAKPAGPLLPLAHLRYDPHHPLLNDAPDVVEIAEALGRARRSLDSALQTCDDAVERARLEEDEHRFTYGEAMFQFYHHLIRTALHQRSGRTEAARREFARARELADRLRNITDMTQGAGAHSDAPNGFEASQAAEAYGFFAQLYGPPPALSK